MPIFFPVDPDEERKREKEYEGPVPDFPPKLIYHGRRAKGEAEIPEHIRRIFGTNDFHKYKRPMPPVPPPPGAYHKKPLYWQMEGTGFASPLNRLALMGVGLACVVISVIVKFGKWPQRVDRWLGTEDENSPEWFAEHQRQVKFYEGMMFNVRDDIAFKWETMDKVKNVIPEYRAEYRWDIAEVDHRIQEISNMRNLKGSHIKGRFNE